MILGLLAYAAQRDISAETLCKLAGTSLARIQDDGHPLAPEQAAAIWTNAIHLSNDPLFGLHFGESLQLSALGIVGEIIKSSNTVGDALTIAASLSHLITTAFTLEISRDQHAFTVKFVPGYPDWQNSIPATQTLDLLMVFVIHEMDGLMLKKIKPATVSHMRPIQNMAEYERVMRCRPADNAVENSITFDLAYWDERIITANYKLQNLLLQKIAPSKPIASQKQSLQVRIHNYLMTNSYLGIVSLDDIAANFNISTRTLQRKLKDEGINFQQLADEARKTLAINYLKEQVYPVKQISYMLGYNELSAFTRTFKRWTGITPASYQKNPY